MAVNQKLFVPFVSAFAFLISFEFHCCSVTAFNLVPFLPGPRPTTIFPWKGPSTTLGSLTEEENEAAESFIRFWREEYQFKTYMRITIYNGTFDDDGKSIRSPRYIVRINANNTDVSAFYRVDVPSEMQTFSLECPRDLEDNATLSIEVIRDNFSCDAIEMTSTEGPRGVFCNPTGKYEPQLMSSSEDPRRNIVKIEAPDATNRLQYKTGDIVFKATVENSYDPLARKEFREEISKLAWKFAKEIFIPKEWRERERRREIDAWIKKISDFDEEV